MARLTKYLGTSSHCAPGPAQRTALRAHENLWNLNAAHLGYVPVGRHHFFGMLAQHLFVRDRFFDTASGGECLLSCESVTSRWPLTRSRPHGMSDWKGETDGKRRFSPGLRFARWKTLREGNLVWKCFLRGASSPCVCRLLIAPDFQVPANKQLREESCIQHLFGA